MIIKESEGHGRLDGFKKGPKLVHIQVCRFKFPRFPMDETKLVISISKETDENLISERKKDLNKIIKYLIRQTIDDKPSQSFVMTKWKNMTFLEFLYEVGMFQQNKFLEYMTEDEIVAAKDRYLKALSASVQGNATVILKREVRDIFINPYNLKIIRLFKSNHDLQICIDPYAALQYVCKYMTKSECGTTQLLRAIIEE